MTREKFDDSIKCLMTSPDILSLNSDTLVPWQFAYNYGMSCKCILKGGIVQDR